MTRSPEPCVTAPSGTGRIGVERVTDVFVSYSRRDADFVAGLVADLEARGKHVWIDVEGIEFGEVFPEAIRAAIAEADAFVFVITPESAASRFCDTEVDCALALSKRIVPVLREAVPDGALPEAIRDRSWVPFTPEVSRDVATAQLIEAIDRDLNYVRAHTRWLVKAVEWEGEGRDRSFLLRGSELAAAQVWLAGIGPAAEPAATQLQREYIYASQAASTRRQRQLVGTSLAVALVSLALLVFALSSRSSAISAQHRATSAASAAKREAQVNRSRAIAEESQAQLVVDPERSILLAMAAMRVSRTPEAALALRHALDVSPLRMRLPIAPVSQSYTGPGVAFSPDGTSLAVGGGDGSVTLFDAASGRIKRRFREGVLPAFLAFSPDGESLALSTGQRVIIVDAATGATRRRAEVAAGDVAFSPDGTSLYFDSDAGRVVCWDLRNGHRRVLAKAPIRGVGGMGAGGSGLYWVAVSPDGRRLAVGGSPGVALLDARSGKVLATADLSRFVAAISFAPDGSSIAVASSPLGSAFLNSGKIALRDSRSLALRRTVVRADGTAFDALAFSRDGNRLAVGAADGSAGVYSVGTGQQLVSLPGHTTYIWGIAFSPDGEDVVTTAGDGRTLVWHVAGSVQRSIDTGGFDTGASGNNYVMADLRLSRDGVIARYAPARGAARGSVVVESWSRKTGRSGRPLIVGPADHDVYVRLGAGARFVATVAGFDPSAPLRVWDVSRRRVVHTTHGGPVAGFGPALSADGSRAALWASGSKGAEIVVVDVGSGRRLHLGTTTCGAGWGHVTLSAEARRVAAVTGCGELDVWNAVTGRRIGRPIPFGTIFNLGPVEFSPDGTRLAIANSANDGQISLFDPKTHRTTSVLTDHTRQVQDLDFSPDGRRLASASIDGTARVWEVANGRLLRVLDHPNAVNNVAFSTDGHSLATLDFAGVIRIWDACPACGDPVKLVALARTRVTRQLTQDERRTFLG